MPPKKRKGGREEKKKGRHKVEPPVNEAGIWQELSGLERALATKERRRDEMESDLRNLQSGCDCDGAPIDGGGERRSAQMDRLRRHNRR